MTTLLPISQRDTHALAQRTDFTTFSQIMVHLYRRYKAGADLSAEIARCITWLDRHPEYVSRDTLVADNQRLTQRIAELEANQRHTAKPVKTAPVKAQEPKEADDPEKMTAKELEAYLKANAHLIRAAK